MQFRNPEEDLAVIMSSTDNHRDQMQPTGKQTGLLDVILGRQP
jgi:hypothetical protein